MSGPRICVVGASNIDLISYVKRLPKMGETLHGTRFHMGFGGKGANQAVMAAKLDAQVSMITKLGKDMFGENTLKNFKSFGIDCSNVLFTDKAFSGVAPITVDPDGNNAIIIVTGANDLLSEEEINQARPVIASSRILICQLEVPVEISLAALKAAREENVKTILNPAPASADLPEEIYSASDILCPNESETEILTGMHIQSTDQAEKAAKQLLKKGTDTVILTLGDRGSLLVTKEKALHIPTRKVKAVDSTGAGDAFVGSLAFFLASGKTLQKAVEYANYIAAVSVQASGTQTSFPDAAALPSSMFSS
ncbi:MAG: ribokinase [Spirochaetota bacterium]